MDKKELDKLRASIMWGDEVLKVKYVGKKYSNWIGRVFEVKSYSSIRTGLEYPMPKRMASDYRLTDDDGDTFPVAQYRYGQLVKDFKWVML